MKNNRFLENPEYEKCNISSEKIFFIIAGIFFVIMIIGKTFEDPALETKKETSKPITYSMPVASSYNGATLAASQFLKANLNDPKSLEVINVGYILKLSDEDFAQLIKYRAKNRMGALVIEEKYILIKGTGYNAYGYGFMSEKEFKRSSLKVIEEYDHDGRKVR